jgi:hypothetical protein
MQWLELFSTRESADRFTKHQHNPRNVAVTKVIEEIILSSIDVEKWMTLVNLGWRWDTHRYDKLLTKIHELAWSIHWVNIAPIILEVWKEYAENMPYSSSIEYINENILSYLRCQQDASINIIMMRYTLDYLSDLDAFFALVAKKLAPWGIFVSDMTMANAELKSHSTNAKYFFEWKAVPSWETITLQDWDSYTIKFFKESWNPQAWLLPGITTQKYYFSLETIQQAIATHFSEMFIWDWREHVASIRNENQDTPLKSIILRK